MDIEEIFENAKKDPLLFSSINVNELLDKIENETTEYLENKTLGDISKIIFQILSEYTFENKTLGKEIITKYYEKLGGYRYIDKVCDLRLGIFIRWIRNNKLMNGGIVVNIKIGENVQIICKTILGKHISLRYDDCVIFQKLTMEEQLILMSYDYLQKDNENNS
jgi:predicted house-cleaning noncanonical NTP pyrophosphatase (MazG superfamily)